MLILNNNQFLIKKLVSILVWRSLRGALEGHCEVILDKILFFISVEELVCRYGEFGLLIGQLLHKFDGGLSVGDKFHAFVGVLLNQVAQVLLHQGFLIEGLLKLKRDMLLCLALLLQIVRLLFGHLFVDLELVDLHLFTLRSILQIFKILLCGISRILSILGIALGIGVSAHAFPLVIVEVERRGDVALDAGHSSVLPILLLREEIEVSWILGLQIFDHEIMSVPE